MSSYRAYVILEHSVNLIYQVPHISAPTIVVDILPAYIIVGQVSIYTWWLSQTHGAGGNIAIDLIFATLHSSLDFHLSIILLTTVFSLHQDSWPRNSRLGLSRQSFGLGLESILRSRLVLVWVSNKINGLAGLMSLVRILVLFSKFKTVKIRYWSWQNCQAQPQLQLQLSWGWV